MLEIWLAKQNLILEILKLEFRRARIARVFIISCIGAFVFGAISQQILGQTVSLPRLGGILFPVMVGLFARPILKFKSTYRQIVSHDPAFGVNVNEEDFKNAFLLSFWACSGMAALVLVSLSLGRGYEAIFEMLDSWKVFFYSLICAWIMYWSWLSEIRILFVLALIIWPVMIFGSGLPAVILSGITAPFLVLVSCRGFVFGFLPRYSNAVHTDQR